MSNSKTKIAVAGIGGIGGYIGGKLALYAASDSNIEVTFICRGDHATAIRQHGLILHTNQVRQVCFPQHVSSNPQDIGVVDVLIICTKQFSVAAIVEQYHSWIDAHTMIITTQNTVNGKATLLPLLPDGTIVLEGCIYIASNLVAAGEVQHLSGPAKLFIGTDGEKNERGMALVDLFNRAGIDTTWDQTITALLWKKFMFVSPAAIVTALYEISFSKILQNDESAKRYRALISELMQLAEAKGIAVDVETIENNCKLLANFGPTAKSSFLLDLEKKKMTEIDSLVNDVVDSASALHVSMPEYTKALRELKGKYLI